MQSILVATTKGKDMKYKVRINTTVMVELAPMFSDCVGTSEDKYHANLFTALDRSCYSPKNRAKQSWTTSLTLKQVKKLHHFMEKQIEWNKEMVAPQIKDDYAPYYRYGVGRVQDPGDAEKRKTYLAELRATNACLKRVMNQCELILLTTNLGKK
jgi:hypothetical protein